MNFENDDPFQVISRTRQFDFQARGSCGVVWWADAKPSLRPRKWSPLWLSTVGDLFQLSFRVHLNTHLYENIMRVIFYSREDWGVLTEIKFHT